MAALNNTQIFDGITSALHTEYPNASVYGDTVTQGLSDGDFVVLPINTTDEIKSGVRSKKCVSFDVIYFPTDSGGRSECLTVGDVLSHILASITTPNGDIVHLKKCECTIDDNVLHCTVSYENFVYVPVTHDKMGTLSIEI